ncbi:MAG: adenosylmethionine-8-amino-7-oxononanoate aminotransferase [Cognaticolwellia sp.]|jgi:adenosylmethionine-8-amino-7-oxononanoate aminotransferase
MSYRVLNSQLICADYDRTYPSVVRGEGAYFIDDKGRRYLDVSGATAAVTHLGHGNERVAQALADQARTLAVHPTHLFHSPVIEAYFERLCAFAPEGFNRAWTISGGTEAVENALKLAFQYHHAKGRSTRRRFIGRWSSYHGNSLATLDVGGNVGRRTFYADLFPDLHLHTESCLPYRRPADMSVQAYEDQLVEEFRTVVDAHPDEIAAFLAEPVVGSALGAAVPTQGYFRRISEICRANDILMIADEVMTGFGRTGRRFGCEHFGTHADVLACAKGISGGYLPLGAILVHDNVAEVLRASGNPFFSGQTYSCTPLAAAVGLAVLDEIEDHGLVERAATVGAYLKDRLESRLLDLPCVGEVRGLGMFLGVEFVQNKDTKEPWPDALRFSKRVEAAALGHGLVTLGARGCVDRVHGDHMLISPPLILTESQADTIADGLRAACEDVLAELD